MENIYKNILKELFIEHIILEMPTIQKLVPNRSRCSLFRDLQKINYISSYNKAGRYYTIKDIPCLDANGIWKYNGVYFSSWGSLKNTVKNMVYKSEAGHTHSELQQNLEVRAHNTLLDLLSSGEIGRETFDGSYLYTHIDAGIKAKQMNERENICKKPLAEPYLVIEVLRAVIKYPDKAAGEIQSYLLGQNIKASLHKIVNIFELYDLGKKNSL